MKRLAVLLVLAVSAFASAEPTAPTWLGYKMPNGPSDPFRYYIDSRVPTTSTRACPPPAG
jgi:hypothetical protein